MERFWGGFRQKGREMKWPVKGRADDACTYRLDPKATPKAFDASLPGDFLTRVWPVQGIYRLRSDRLELCVTALPNDEPRPTEFKTDRTHWTIRYVFERSCQLSVVSYQRALIADNG